MKKLIFCLSLLLVCSHGFAASLSDVLSWKYGNCFGTKQANPNDNSPNPQMIISVWNCGEPQPTDGQIIIDTNDYLNSNAYKVSEFNPDVLKVSMFLAFQDNLSVLKEWAGLFDQLLKFENFPAIKGIVNSQFATEDQAIIKGVFMQQNINLDDF